MEKILTVNDVAAVLQVKAITVREMFREKRLRGFKVGKSWRTTEVMLQEDINALARGEMPAELPSPPVSAPTASAASRGKTAAPVRGAVAAPAPAEPVASPRVDTPAPPRASKKPLPKDADETAEDTQQLLF